MRGDALALEDTPARKKRKHRTLADRFILASTDSCPYRKYMGGKLLREIHKIRPFDSVQQELFLNIIRTADHLMRGFDELMKPLNLSSTQYNILRILRGAGEAGLACKHIGEHLITRDPDITRLLDRLERRGLIVRHRDPRDRRRVSTRITEAGLKILKELDKPVLELHRRQVEHLAEGQVMQLIDLMEAVREAGE